MRDRRSKRCNKSALALFALGAVLLLLAVRQPPTIDTTTISPDLKGQQQSKYGPWCPLHNCGDSYRNIPREAWTTAAAAADEAETDLSNNQWVNVTTQINPDASFVMRIRDPTKDSFISKSIQLGNVWDADIANEMVDKIDEAKTKGVKSPIVVDVGGNIGYFTHLALALGATTITLEPMRENLGPMLSTIRANDGWQNRSTVYNNAVSFESTTRVHMKSTSTSINLSNGHIINVECGGKDVSSSEQQQQYGVDYMETVTLDQVLLEHHSEVERIHFMKIDVETFEVQVMSGAVGYLCNRMVEEIALEVAFLGNASCETDDMLRFLESIGYRIYYQGTEYTGQPLQEMPNNIFLKQHYTDEPPAQRLKNEKVNPCRDYELL